MEAQFARTRIPRILPISQCLVCVYSLFLVLYMARDFLLPQSTWGIYPEWTKYLYFIGLFLCLVTGFPLVRFKQAAMKHWTAMQFWISMIILFDAARHLVAQSVRLQPASDAESWMVMTFFYAPICRAILFRGILVVNFLLIGMAIAILPFRSFSCSAGGPESSILLCVAQLTVSLIFAWLLERMERQEYLVRMQLDEEIQVRKAAEEAALEARDAQGNFLARMSHEIRTPLNGILGLINLLLEIELVEEALDLLVRLKGAGDHLMCIVNDVLDLAKITAGKLELKPSATRIHEMPRICFDLFASKLTDKHLHHHVHVDPDVPLVLYGDRTRLMQILTNLVSNAVKFTPQNGHISIQVRLLSKQTHLQGDAGAGCAPAIIGVEDVDNSSLFPPESSCGLSVDDVGHTSSLKPACPLSEPGPSTMWATSRGCSPNQNPAVFSHPDSGPDCTSILSSSSSPSHSIGRTQVLPVYVGPESRSHSSGCSQLLPSSVVLEVAVRDSGKGMTKAQQSMLFTPYYQCESGIDREQEGTGLGLSIVKKLVELMGGTLSVASTLGTGTSFTLNIPFQVNVETSAAGDHSSHSPRPQMNWSGKTCLLVDDTPLNLLVLQRQLEKRGCQVLTANSGHKCIDTWKMEHQRLDFIFLDIWMPGLNGLEATKELRGLGARLPIIGLTADTTSSIVTKGLLAGMTSVLLKPVPWDQMERVLVENLPRSTPHSNETIVLKQ
uniref:histidine kinase n=1 Tax=Eutreptiella gymnastica TaxID=73025 RepID=A0A7S1IFJ4_9EUGL